MVPGGTTPNPNHSPEESDKRWNEWVKNGKPADKFDHTDMGLQMLTIPAKHFGWEGMTETMKKVFVHAFNTFI